MPVPAVHLVRPQEHAAEPQLPDTAAGLRHGVVDVERGDHPGAEQALGVLLAKLVQPVVVRARHGRGESRLHVGNGQGEEAPRGIDHRDVDALDVHRLDLDLRGPAPLLERPPALLVLRMVMPVTAPAAIGVRGDAPPRLAIPGQAQVPGIFGEPLRGAIPERGIDVPLPEIGRLDDVDVAVEHLEASVRHGPPPKKGFASATGYRNSGMMCLANSSIWRISSSHGMKPWSKNQPNHSRSPPPPIASSDAISALTLVHRSGQPVFHPAHPLQRPFRGRQRRVRIERVLGGVLRGAKRLPEAEAGEVVLEARVVGVAQERHGLGLGLAEVHGAEGAHALAETELSPRLPRHLPVGVAEALEVGRVSHEDPGNDARLRGVADRRLAHREGLEQRRMRILVGLRHDADLADDALVVDLTGRPVLAGPVGDRPPPDALLVREGHLVVLAVVVPGFLGPRLLDDLERFLVDVAVVIVDGGAVHGRARHVILLAEDVDPSVLVAAREARVHPPLGQVVEDGDLLRGADGIPRRQHQPERRELDALGAGGEVRVEQQRSHRGLVALGVEMVLGGREDVEPGIVGEHGELAQLVQHLLVSLVVSPDGPEPLAILQRAGHGRQHEQHELHGRASFPDCGITSGGSSAGPHGSSAPDHATRGRHRMHGPLAGQGASRYPISPEATGPGQRRMMR